MALDTDLDVEKALVLTCSCAITPTLVLRSGDTCLY